MKRRDFFRAVALGAGAALTGAAAYNMRYNRWALRATRRSIPVAGLPPSLQGLRIAVMSDLHAGDFTPWWLAHKAVALAVQEQPDLIFLLGDYASLRRKKLRKPLEETLAPLRAPHGVWAVLGNHEYVMGRRPYVLEALASCGIHVLLNESRAVTIRGQEVWLCGLEDPYLGRHDFDKTMADVPAGAVTFLLAHSPDIIYSAAQLAINAVFAGHTHGGQVVLPLVGPIVVPSRYGTRFAYGLFREARTAMYVTRGVGMTPPLVRFCCPPEVAVLTLQPTA
jgi:predicted MPP superfamily phosphohydrolase